MVDEREFGWDDEISNDGDDFVLLTPGDYDFEVTGFERGRHTGSEKLPPCYMAILTIRIDGRERGTAMVKHRLFLHTKTEGLLCQFFRAIGARQHGESMRMDWNAVPGARGRCKVATRHYNGNEYNEIKAFLDPKEKPEPNSGGGWQAGTF